MSKEMPLKKILLFELAKAMLKTQPKLTRHDIINDAVKDMPEGLLKEFARLDFDNYIDELLFVDKKLAYTPDVFLVVV